MKKYIPLVLVEVYLITTLLILVFGVVEFKIHNKDLFWLCILLYHISFITGYVLAAQIKAKHLKIIDTRAYSSKRFYTLLTFAIFGILLTYKNLIISESYIPYNIYNEVARGLSEPGLVYTERMLTLSSGENNNYFSRVINLLSMAFLFVKLLFVFYCVYFWRLLGFAKKFLCLAYCFLYLLPGIASGTNSVVFQLMIFLSSSIISVAYIKRSKFFHPMIFFSTIMLTAAILSFGFIMSQRGGGFDYFASTSPLGDISTTASTPEPSGFIGLFTYAAGWLNYYLVQGYYGFSLIFDVDWTCTFGFGNSEFLQRQFLLITGVDISNMTYQAKVNAVWDKSAQWHSFYSQFANDFGLLGLAFFMFVLGVLLARVWHSVIYNDNFYAAALLPIFVIMFIFFPANNQVFAYIDTLSYFIVVSSLWLFSKKQMRL